MRNRMNKNTNWLGMGVAVGLAIGACSAGASTQAMLGADIAAGAKWGACLNVRATENSDVFESLSQMIAHERLDSLYQRAREDWSIDLDTLETLSVYGADEDWGAVTLVARGDFSAVDFAGIPEETSPWRNKYTIHRYAPLDHINLLFAKHSNGVLVGADTVEGVRRALDVLDGRYRSHAEVADQPEKIRKQFGSSVCVMGLDVNELRKELNLESALLNGTSQAWFTLQEGPYQVTAEIHMDHASDQAAYRTVSSLGTIFRRAFETDTTPAPIAEFLNALYTRVDGNWVTAEAMGSPDEMVDLLQGLQGFLSGK